MPGAWLALLSSRSAQMQPSPRPAMVVFTDRTQGNKLAINSVVHSTKAYKIHAGMAVIVTKLDRNPMNAGTKRLLYRPGKPA